MTGALHGQVALVTGAARGIGRAIARKLAAEGADVAVNYYNSHDEAEALCAEMRALGRRAIAIQGSVGVPDSVDEMFAALAQAIRPASTSSSATPRRGVLKPVIDMGLKHWRWCMETNALAVEPARAARAADDEGRRPHHRDVEPRRVSARCPTTGSSARRRPRSRRWCARSRRSSGRAASASTR